MTTQCTSTCLASHGSFTVERCSCGWISVHVGAMTLRLESAAMEQLATILGEAAVNNRKIHAQEELMGFGLVSPLGAMDNPEEASLDESQTYHSPKKLYH